MRLIPCQSSNLRGIAYEPGTTEFFVEFNNGSVYCYDSGQDTAAIVTDILFAKSQGLALKDSIAGLPYYQVEDPMELDLHV